MGLFQDLLRKSLQEAQSTIFVVKHSIVLYNINIPAQANAPRRFRWPLCRLEIQAPEPEQRYFR